MKKQKTWEALSAGGVVWRRSGLTTEIVIGYIAKDNRWGLPKGTTEKDETLVETALREVQEETGLLVQIGEKIGVIEYWFTVNSKKKGSESTPDLYEAGDSTSFLSFTKIQYLKILIISYYSISKNFSNILLFIYLFI